MARREMRDLVENDAVLVVVVLVAALMIAGCGGDSVTGSSQVTTTSSTTTTSVAGPSRAAINLTVANAIVFVTGRGNAVGFDMRISESAGLGADINFIRLEIFRATGEFEERQEMGAGAIIEQFGNNRIEANATRLMPVIFIFRATVQRGRLMRLTVGFTDDRDNTFNEAEDFVF